MLLPSSISDYGQIGVELYDLDLADRRSTTNLYVNNFRSQAGYFLIDRGKIGSRSALPLDTATELELAIRQLIAENEALADRTGRFGTFYEVKGLLKGINGIDLGVVTIWLHESVDKQIRFITLIPN